MTVFTATHNRAHTLERPYRSLQAQSSGGFEEIYRSISRRLPDIRTNAEIVRICPRRRIAWFADGRGIQWEFLVSTAPLPSLLRIIDDAPGDLVRLADTLAYMSLRVELIVADGPPRSPIQRVYVHDPAIAPHNIAFNHNSSAFLRSQPRQAIMAEVSVSPHKLVQREEIAPQTVNLLCDPELLSSPRNVVDIDHIDVKYGYPVYTKERPAQVLEIKNWFRANGIFTAGRFGDWEYVNSDNCVSKGLKLGAALWGKYLSNWRNADDDEDLEGGADSQVA